VDPSRSKCPEAHAAAEPQARPAEPRVTRSKRAYMEIAGGAGSYPTAA
jgi:hypothetical protein